MPSEVLVHRSTLLVLIAVGLAAQLPMARRATAQSAQVSEPAAPASAPAPFAWGDFTWMNGQSRQKSFPLAFSPHLTLSTYLDVYYAYSLNQPRDNTLTGGATIGRHNEFQINLASVGVEWNYQNVIGRLSLQYGGMLNIVQNLDGTVARGRSLSTDALKYIREATLGYHFNVDSGLNVEAGIFMSYIGLESYLLAENWNYTRSIVCDHTPFYFQGVRVQYFPSPQVKIEPWLMNGWQSYGKWNFAPSGGLAIRWSPIEALTIFGNFYVGTDTGGVAERVRAHHDNSIVARYFDEPRSDVVSKLAFSLNTHIGFEAGGAGLPGPEQAHMFGVSLAQRIWFHRDLFSLALRAEYMSNPTRYLAQYPPPDLAAREGGDLRIWGLTATVEVMPTDFLSVRAELMWRQASVPYFAGPLGTTSSTGFQGGPTDGFVVDSSRDQVVAMLGANFRL